MAVDCEAIMNALITHAQKLGYFSNVNGHQAKSPNINNDQVNLSFSAGVLVPVLSSGLKSVSYRWEINAQVFGNADAEPADSVDPSLMTAVVALFTSLAGGFTLGGRIRHVDFYGSDGEQLSATPGYWDNNGQTFRLIELRIPLIINDVMDLGA